MKNKLSLKPHVVLSLALCASALTVTTAHALPQYRLIAVSGDVNFIADLNNNNQVLMGSGQCPPASVPCTFIRNYNPGSGTLSAGTAVVGLPYPGAPGGSAQGTVVDQFNSGLDMIGTSDARFGGLNIPTIWMGGVPFNRSDPANAGLSFTRDAGTGATFVSLATLDIVNFASLGLGAIDQAALLAGTYSGRFNANGFYTIRMSVPGTVTDGWLLAPLAAVPEPGTVGMLATGLLVLVWRLRSR